MSDIRRPKVTPLEAERWTLPPVGGAGPIFGGPRTDEAKREDNERAQRETLKSRGYEEGMAAAKAEIAAQMAKLDARIRRLDSILNFLSKPLEELDEEVQKQLSTLALTVGKQLARRELKSEPAQIIAIIREAVSRLPAAVRDIRVHLHPEDARIVRERLSTPANERAWTVVEDPALSQGGCLVRTDNSQIDARLNSRLNAIVSSILGDERAPARALSETEVVESMAAEPLHAAVGLKVVEPAVAGAAPTTGASPPAAAALPNPEAVEAEVQTLEPPP